MDSFLIFYTQSEKLAVGVGVLDDPAAKQQFGMAAEKCCAFSGGMSRTPSPTDLCF